MKGEQQKYRWRKLHFVHHLLPYTQINTIKHQYPNLGIVVHKNPSQLTYILFWKYFCEMNEARTIKKCFKIAVIHDTNELHFNACKMVKYKHKRTALIMIMKKELHFNGCKWWNISIEGCGNLLIVENREEIHWLHCSKRSWRISSTQWSWHHTTNKLSWWNIHFSSFWWILIFCQ